MKPIIAIFTGYSKKRSRSLTLEKWRSSWKLCCTEDDERYFTLRPCWHKYENILRKLKFKHACKFWETVLVDIFSPVCEQHFALHSFCDFYFVYFVWTDRRLHLCALSLMDTCINYMSRLVKTLNTNTQYRYLNGAGYSSRINLVVYLSPLCEDHALHSMALKFILFSVHELWIDAFMC